MNISDIHPEPKKLTRDESNIRFSTDIVTLPRQLCAVGFENDIGRKTYVYSDSSDLQEKYHWCESHPEECKTIVTKMLETYFKRFTDFVMLSNTPKQYSTSCVPKYPGHYQQMYIFLNHQYYIVSNA